MNVGLSTGGSPHRHIMQALPFCAELCLAGLAACAYAGTGAWFAVILLAVVSIAAWLGTLRTLHTISATPLSRIASAAQGYVALQGRGRPLAGLPLVSPFSFRPVLWYRLHIEQRDNDDNWQSFSRDSSDACLILEDESGQCAIDPEKADVLTGRRETATRDNMRFTHWCLIEGDPLFVLGDFRTQQGESLAQTERETTKEILSGWKKDKPELLRRFDLNKDGEIDETEWELARTAAAREARRERVEADQAAQMHIVRRPPDKRPFIISSVKPWRMKLQHRAWCVWHAAMFLVSCVAIAVLLQTGALALP